MVGGSCRIGSQQTPHKMKTAEADADWLNGDSAVGRDTDRTLRIIRNRKMLAMVRVPVGDEFFLRLTRKEVEMEMRRLPECQACELAN